MPPGILARKLLPNMAELRARAIVFDKDGVLVDTMSIIRGAWKAWAARRSLPADEVLSSIHMTAYELLARFAPSADPAAELGWISAHQATLERVIEPFPGVRDLIARLPEGRWAIVTSGRRAAASRHLAMAGLPLPAVLIAAEDTPRGKPDPAGYRLAATRLGVPPAACLAIEDTPAGVRAAVAAGMRVLAVTNTHPPHELGEAEMVLDSLEGLDVLLD